MSVLKSHDGEANSLLTKMSEKNHLMGIGWGFMIKSFLIALWKGVDG